MGFTARQNLALKRNLDHRYVRTREAHGRELSYIEGWYAISEANRIFGCAATTRMAAYRQLSWPAGVVGRGQSKGGA